MQDFVQQIANFVEVGRHAIRRIRFWIQHSSASVDEIIHVPRAGIPFRNGSASQPRMGRETAS